LYNNICIIGAGTIGGFLTYNLYHSEISKSFTIFDYDTVELKNIRNSIYTKKDIGKLKTDAIFKKLDEPSNVIIRNEKFIEGATKNLLSDLVIDCRDFIYDRKNIIDLRLYISGKNLVLDCRKNIKKDFHHEGQYTESLSKIDIHNASLNASILISNGLIKDLINNQLVHHIPLDSTCKIAKQIIQNNKNKDDIIYDFTSLDKKLLNLHENYTSIIKINKYNDITIYLGSKSQYYQSKVIPKLKFKTINDIISECSLLMNKIPYHFNSYILSINSDSNQYFIELLPETGGA